MVSLNLLLVATVWTYWNHEPADHLRRMSSCASTVHSAGAVLLDGPLTFMYQASATT